MLLKKTTSAPTCTATASDGVVSTDDRHPQNNVLEETELATSTVNRQPDDGPYNRLNNFHTTTDNSEYTRVVTTHHTLPSFCTQFSINQSVSQSINQSINQSDNRFLINVLYAI